MDKQTFNERLKERFGDEHYTVLHYGEKSNDISVFQCLDCERRIEVRNSYLFSKKRSHICTKCHYKRKDTARNEAMLTERLISHGHRQISFFMQDRKGIRHNMIHFECGRCGRVNEKEVANFLTQKYDCGYCEGQKESKDTDSFIRELRERHGEQFTVLSEYHNATTKITVRCNGCGFIRQVKPNTLLVSGYCPKCGKKESKGERIIKNFLEACGIEFESQKYFSEWGIGIHYFDFYIPEYNLVLEYHGRHHYEFVSYFHKTEENFQYRLLKDKQKKETALLQGLNYVSINHSIEDLKKTLSHLFNSTTIPQGSRGKCFEIETIQDLDEDIVYSSLKDEVEK